MNRWIAVVMTGALGVAASAACHSKSSAGGACADLYNNVVVRCDLAGYPSSEISRLAPRWDTYCESLLDLPGATATTSSVEECAQAYASLDCNSPVTPPSCNSLNSGDLGGGMPCVTSSQCASATCVMGSSEGGAALTCGACATLVPIGGACGAENQACGPNASCGGENAASTCMAIPNGVDAGEPSFQTVGAGAACNGETGSVCNDAFVCVSGTCVAPTFAAAGQPCNDAAMGCLVGECNGSTVTTEPDGGFAYTSGTCPSVIPDGQPCDEESVSTTCDTLSNCVNGTCQLALSTSGCM